MSNQDEKLIKVAYHVRASYAVIRQQRTFCFIMCVKDP